MSVPLEPNTVPAGAGADDHRRATDGRRALLRSARRSGFTLLEMVVVILITGILVTFAMLSIGNRPTEDKLDNEAKRLQAILQLASEESEARGVEIGLRFSRDGFRLLAVDENRRWNDYERQGSLRRRALPEPLQIRLRVEGRPVELEAEDPKDAQASGLPKDDGALRLSDKAKALEPQILLLSSGEMTPFSLEMLAPGLAYGYRLEADLFGRLTLTRITVGRG